ncbi:MAG TPA: integrin alpha [Planctomycetota bacterium]
MAQRSQHAPAGPPASGGSLGGAARGPGSIVSTRKISNAVGGFPDTLDERDAFGRALAFLGDVDGDGIGDLAVGAPGDVTGSRLRGAVWILFLAADGSVRARQRIAAGEGGLTQVPLAGGEFGCALAALGDLDGNGVSELAVGNRFDPTGGRRRGAVWVLFLARDGTVERHRKLGSGMGGFGGALADSDAFGSALAALGDLDGDGAPELAVGATGDDGGGSAAGALWILSLRRDGSVRAQRRLGAPEITGLEAGDELGGALAALDVDGDGIPELAAGASRDDDGGAEHGAVRILFLAPDGSLRGQQKISATEGGFTGVLGIDLFGSALARVGDLDGDGLPELAVGADNDDDGGFSSGATWILFLEPSGRVRAQAKISATTGGLAGLSAFDRFGSSAALLGDLDGDGLLELAVGARGDKDGGGFDRGALWILSLAPTGSVGAQSKISDRPGSFAGTLDFGDGFGSAVVALGDLDGDGVGDLAVGAEGDEDGGVQVGAVWLLFMNPSGTVREHAKISATQGGFGGVLDIDDRFGHSLAAPGDVDGDGVPDLFVGANRDRDGGRQTGAVWLLFLRRDGTVKGQRKYSASEDALAGVLPSDCFFGYSLAVPGDLDGDGTKDLVVGALLDDDGGLDRGALWVLFLRPDGSIRAFQKISALSGGLAGGLSEPLPDQAGFGHSLAALGDLDGDGVGDLAVGAPSVDFFGSEAGAVYVLFLRRDGTVRSARTIDSSRGGFGGTLDARDGFGAALASPGDLDGDGWADLVVGADGDDDGGREFGALWVLFLTADGGVRTQRKISATEGGFDGPLRRQDRFGSALASLGDRDGDGVGDLAVGAVGDQDGGDTRGALWLLSLDGVARLGFEQGDDGLARPLANGLALGSGAAFGRTVRITGAGANLGPALFDSTPGGPNDPSQDLDLLVGSGKLLILQDARAGTQGVPGVFDRPNDAAAGGTLTFDFVQAPIEALSLDLVDIDRAAGLGAVVRLLDRAGHERRLDVPAGWTEDHLVDGPPGRRTLDLRALLPQPGFAAWTSTAQDPAFDSRAVVRIVVELAGSGAVDELRWRPHPGE